ncbi:MAG: shikimate dehydrogenase [Leptospira sp.]|nr:shikimate dehydrogenase [Leptospira sp.]
MKSFYPNSNTKTFGIIGFPLSHTLSPVLHSLIYERLEINAIYKVFTMKDPTKEDLLTLHKYGLHGLSVTIPHKEWAFKIADHIHSSAQWMKSSNTLFFQNGEIHAYNTDGLGALHAIKNHNPKLLNPSKPGDILLIGSGGSARGIGFSILEEFQSQLKNTSDRLNKHIVITARNIEKGTQLMNEMNEFLPGSTLFIPLHEMQSTQPTYIELYIHTTNVGMLGQESESILPKSSLHSDATVFDIVYNPIKTPLVKLAKEVGCEIIPGIDMLIYQGLEQNRIFTGTYTPKSFTKKIRKTLLNNLKQ